MFMFPSGRNEFSSTTPPPHLPVSGNGDRVEVPGQEELLSPQQAREVVRLLQCPQCSYPLEEPITLPCGKTLCKKCQPRSHLRTNISYPPLANRLQGFKCPFPECNREHSLGDCTVDVTLSKTVAVVKAEFEDGRKDAVAACIATNVIVKDAWQEAGVPTLKDTETTSRLVQGGILLATYTLAESGDLGYSAEATYGASADLAAGSCQKDTVLLARVKEVARLELDCQVCYALLYDPLTTPCGHTFCRACLHRVLDHSSCCPVCRRALSISPPLFRQACPSNELLTKVITVFWADALELRRQAVIAEGSLQDNADFDIPVFVCTLSFPHMPTFLHVFEPRYRLMVRRALEGDRMFGMVAFSPLEGADDTDFMELGTMLRINNVEFFADGRSLLETVGVSRFRILRRGVLDGYAVAKIERITDIGMAEEEELEAAETRSAQGIQTFMAEGESESGVEEGAEPAAAAVVTAWPNHLPPATLADLDAMATRDLMVFAADFVRRMREQSVNWLATRMLAIYGDCPTDPAVFPWWFASVLPMRDGQKYRLLGTTSVRERLKICCAWALEWEGDNRW